MRSFNRSLHLIPLLTTCQMPGLHRPSIPCPISLPIPLAPFPPSLIHLSPPWQFLFKKGLFHLFSSFLSYPIPRLSFDLFALALVLTVNWSLLSLYPLSFSLYPLSFSLWPPFSLFFSLSLFLVHSPEE
ncbi:MAG: hypothetical protein J3R72DRAFT_187357 [Linnemannia gamsii]|nr:MAG: hypothetical protein J3R72DRAFT_187357 [Linnemannia gamsii]